MEKFRVRRRDAFNAQNGPINFYENAHIHRFEMLITFSFLCYLLDVKLALVAIYRDAPITDDMVKTNNNTVY